MTHERRRMPRYRLHTAVAVGDGTERTLNVSANGMLFESTRSFAPGDPVALHLTLEHAGPGACVRCEGQVVRIETRGDVFAIAVTYEPAGFSVATRR